tara:strand:+ start:136 stop:624 length:489 start_codon:yes stop_codon:yes gene_type:complete
MSEIKGITKELTDKVLNGEVVDLFEKKRDTMIEQIEDLLLDLHEINNIIKDYQYNPKINKMITRRFDNGLFIEYDLKNDTMEVYEYINYKKYIIKEHDDESKGIYHKRDGNDDYLIVLDNEKAENYNSKVFKVYELIDDSHIFDCDDYELYESRAEDIFILN